MHVDGVLILGKELRHFPDRARRELMARSAAAAVALRAHGAQAAVSLEAPLVGQEDAGSAIVARFLRELGVSPERMVLDERTRSTREEAVEGARVADRLGWKRVLVVTSAYHVPRARRVFGDVLGEGRFTVHVPEALLQHAGPQERQWILEGVPDSAAMRFECTVEALWSQLERLISPLPARLRWQAEMRAGDLLRGVGDRV